MEHPSFNDIASQYNYLGQTHKRADTNYISSYKEICKQLDICQKKLREEREQKEQRKLRKSISYSTYLSQKDAQQPQQSQRGRNDDVATIGSKQLKQQKEESALHVEEKRLIRIKNALWRRMGSLVGCIGKENKPISLKTLKCPSPYQREDIYFEQKKDCPTNTDSLTNVDSSYISVVPRYNRYIQNRRIRRRIRHENAINSYSLNNYLRQLPRQTTNNTFANQIFNGVNW
ncbi:hypothetical protein RclHR1_04150003 [Rhizophagus clarus]|uniref:Uncharacterized protein n=1 Tax=Rhizophagus clarus TaxID=94130 RepID=A0A2Z6SA47_9GLOM|nr:hypothetical protein RclHR1_04150003 [Rhizophagus clarus]GES85630.1 hypothetical protein GLOIN_2v1835733 [Rhizophagus clarus]